MALPLFPSLRGIQYPTEKIFKLDTIVQMSQSGHEVRLPNWTQARYQWRLPYGYLPNYFAPNDPTTQNPVQWPQDSLDLQTLAGFYELMLGQGNVFRFFDPTDYTTSPNLSSPTPSAIGIGDGVTTAFQLARVWAGMPHFVYAVNSTTVQGAPKIYINNSLQSGGSYSIGTTGVVTFNSAPSFGSSITADFSFYFVCRFATDENDWINSAGPFWETKDIILYEVSGGV